MTTNMKKTVTWYEVTYEENGVSYQVRERGRKEARELHKAHPGSTFKVIRRKIM